MARYIAAQTGNYGTSSTWDTVANTPLIIGSDQTITTTPINSAAWTAPNTTNAVTGVALYLTGKGTANSITVTLQENSAGYVDTSATKTISLANVNIGYIYLRFPTPYTYTSTASNRYRIMTSVDTGTCTVALAAVGSTHYMATDDRHAVPTTDNVWVIGHNEQTAITVTIDGTRTCGTSNVASPTSRSITNGFIVGNGGTLSHDTTASSQLTCTGCGYVDVNGEYNAGSVMTPLSSSYTATLIMSGAAGNAAFYVATGGRCILQGTPKSSTSLWKGTLASGVGTAASPAILNEAVNWNVGDQVVIAANSANGTNYNETETRYIITKNSATSYVWSATSGGSEAALTNTHAAGSLVVNIQRNILITTPGASNGQSYFFNSQPNQTNIDIDWARFEYVNPTLFFSVAPLGQLDVQNNVSMDYTVAYYSPVVLFRINTKTTTQTHNGLVAYSPVASTAGVNPGIAGSFAILNCQGQTLNDCISLQNGQCGFSINNSFTNTFNRCQAISSNTSNNIPTAAGFLSYSSGQNSYPDCEVHCNRGGAVRLNTSLGEVFSGLLAGTKGVNGSSIAPSSSTFNDVLFDSCIFGDATIIDNYKNQTIGSEIRFNRLNDTDMQHRWYTVYGSARSVGTGLTDTTVRTAGSYALRIDPENATTGFTWEFYISAKSQSVTNFFGWFRKNTAFGTDDANIELWLPGSSSADVSFQLSDATETWQSAVESVDYPESIDGLATVKVVAKSATSGAYLYCDDFYNAGDTVNTFDKMTGLDTWINGKPSPLLNPTVLQPIDFWNFPTNNLNTPGTVGYIMKRVLTVAKFLGLK